jgi:hypothetical protein
MKMTRVLLLLFSLCLLLSGCDLFNADAVTVNSVDPDSGLVDGQWYTFTVTVHYRLSSAEQGELSVGFNNGDASDVSYMVTSEDVIVEKGAGEHTFHPHAMAKEWAGTPFQAIVTLSEYPHASSWKNLDSDKRNLHF